MYGYDINGDYLAACEARYRHVLGDRLHLVETTINRSLTIEPVEIVIANLIIDYVGVQEFAAFAATNVAGIGVLSCVIQHNNDAGFVSATRYATSFDALASVATDVNAETPDEALAVGFEARGQHLHPLPNGKTLVRQDFSPRPRRTASGRSRTLTRTPPGA